MRFIINLQTKACLTIDNKKMFTYKFFKLFTNNLAHRHVLSARRTCDLGVSSAMEDKIVALLDIVEKRDLIYVRTPSYQSHKIIKH